MTEVVPTSDGIQDFSTHKSVRFKIDKANGEPEYFDGLSDLPALLLVEFAAMTDKINETAEISEQTAMFKDLFNLVLTDESAERFIARMRDKNNPVSINQINQILPWIMEQYGMRPTQPSEQSSDGSENPDTGTNSTDAAPPVALTSAPLVANASSI